MATTLRLDPHPEQEEDNEVRDVRLQQGVIFALLIVLMAFLILYFYFQGHQNVNVAPSSPLDTTTGPAGGNGMTMQNY